MVEDKKGRKGERKSEKAPANSVKVRQQSTNAPKKAAKAPAKNTKPPAKGTQVQAKGVKATVKGAKAPAKSASPVKSAKTSAPPKKAKTNTKAGTKAKAEPKTKKKRKKKKRERLSLYEKVQRKRDDLPLPVYCILLFFVTIIETMSTIFAVLFGMGLVFSIAGAALLFFLIKEKPFHLDDKAKTPFGQMAKMVDEGSREDFAINLGSVVYDKDKNVIAKLYDTSFLEYIPYDKIPEDTVNAFVAVEDRTFWNNDGVDYRGILSAVYGKLRGGQLRGASTITQQLARTVYLSREVSIERKLKEVFAAWRMTEKYSKEDIMEFYVKTCCFSNGIYGIQGAAKAYFNKNAKDLTLAQTAYLCAIPNRPSYYDPYKDPGRPKERQQKILSDMYACGYITKEELLTAIGEPVSVTRSDYVFENDAATYAIDCTVHYLMEADGFIFRYDFQDMEEYAEYKENYETRYDEWRDKLYTGGYKVYTSLDMDIYEKMQGIVDKQLAQYNNEIDEDTNVYKLQGALCVINNKTNKVIAVVGGRTQDEKRAAYGLNRAYQSFRQPGSSIKPLIVYTPALENGYKPTSTLYDIDVTRAKEPGADPQKMYGASMTLRSAVEQSKNGCAWRLFDELTPEKGLSYTAEMEFSHIVPYDYNDSVALGGLTYGVSPVEMAGAYETIANLGTYNRPTCLTRLVDKEGENLYKKAESKQVYKEEAVKKMIDVLRGVLTVGTAKKLNWAASSEMDIFGKTGTTNDYKDIWMCGATPGYTVCTWMGFDQPEPMPGITGSSYTGWIFKEAMLALVKDSEAEDFDTVAQAKPNDETKWLEGRDDSEYLSNGYTVGDYRNDRAIGMEVWEVIGNIKIARSKHAPDEEVDAMYEEGKELIKTIYSRNYTNQMTSELEKAYRK